MAQLLCTQSRERIIQAANPPCIYNTILECRMSLFKSPGKYIILIYPIICLKLDLSFKKFSICVSVFFESGYT